MFSPMKACSSSTQNRKFSNFKEYTLASLSGQWSEATVKPAGMSWAAYVVVEVGEKDMQMEGAAGALVVLVWYL